MIDGFTGTGTWRSGYRALLMSIGGCDGPRILMYAITRGGSGTATGSDPTGTPADLSMMRDGSDPTVTPITPDPQISSSACWI